VLAQVIPYNYFVRNLPTKGGKMPSIQDFERWLTTGDTASRLGKTRQGVVWLCENKRLRAARTALGWLVDPKDAERFAGEQREKKGGK